VQFLEVGRNYVDGANDFCEFQQLRPPGVGKRLLLFQHMMRQYKRKLWQKLGHRARPTEIHHSIWPERPPKTEPKECVTGKAG
jgi:hypothetical protein